MELTAYRYTVPWPNCAMRWVWPTLNGRVWSTPALVSIRFGWNAACGEYLPYGVAFCSLTGIVLPSLRVLASGGLFCGRLDPGLRFMSDGGRARRAG